MLFKRKKEENDLMFDEKKGEMYFKKNNKFKKNKIGISKKIIITTILIFLIVFGYRNYFAKENKESIKIVYFSKFGMESVPTINRTDNSGKLKELAIAITDGCKEEEFCKVKRIMNFIEKIPYATGEGQAKTPIEVINTNKGDCDEKTYLFATLAVESKLKPILIYAKKGEIYHAFIGMELKEKKEGKKTYIKIDNKKYYYLETTWRERDIGTFNGYEKENIIGIYDEVNKKKISLNNVELIKDI